MLSFSSYIEDHDNDNEIKNFLNVKEYSKSVDISLLGEYISEDEFIENEGYSFEVFFGMDSDCTVFKNKIKGQEFLCIIHSGYHMIFTKDSELLDLKTNTEHKNNNREPLNWLLSSFNSPSTFSNMGIEKNITKTNNFDIISSDSSVRYVLKLDNEYIAGIHISDDTIQNIFTTPIHTKKGYARKLIEMANKDFPNLQHSKSRTQLGEHLFKNIKLKNNKQNKNITP